MSRDTLKVLQQILSKQRELDQIVNSNAQLIRFLQFHNSYLFWEC